jgi:hypothetical protein
MPAGEISVPGNLAVEHVALDGGALCELAGVGT